MRVKHSPGEIQSKISSYPCDSTSRNFSTRIQHLQTIMRPFFLPNEIKEAGSGCVHISDSGLLEETVELQFLKADSYDVNKIGIKGCAYATSSSANPWMLERLSAAALNSASETGPTAMLSGERKDCKDTSILVGRHKYPVTLLTPIHPCSLTYVLSSL